MRKIVVMYFILFASQLKAEDRFGRPVIKVRDPKSYTFIKLDDVDYATLSNTRYKVSCIVYRGTQHYYVEVTVTNNTSTPLNLSTNFVSMDKPGYSIERGDTMLAARDAAASAGLRFVPTPPPYVPPTYNTTINASASTYGNQTYVNGTATTTADTSGQAGANLGNAIGNAIAAHGFYKMQQINVSFSHFLISHLQTDADSPVSPGQSRTIVTTFDEAKPKKKPFEITLKIGEDTFVFAYKE